MRKEVLFAVFFGALFGLVIAFGVWRLNSSLAEKNEENQTEASPTPGVNQSFGLTITKPNEHQVFSSGAIRVEGATKDGSYVVVSGEDEDSIKKSDDGSFAMDVDGVGGLNQVIVSSFSPEGESTQKQVDVVYSSQFTAVPASDHEATTEAELQDKVREKVKEVVNSPLAYLGTITDIAETTVHVKDDKDEIRQVATFDDTSYANDTTSKEIKFADLAIGDYVIAMGYRNGNQVLNAKRIVVTKAPVSPSRKIVRGSVKSTADKTLILTTKDSEAAMVFPKSWKGPNTKDIPEGAEAIAVSEVIEGKVTLRTIELLK